MPTQPTWPDLLKTTSPLIAMATAGCAASNLLQMHGGDMILGGGLTALGFGAAAATTNVLSGVIANRFHDQSKLRAFDPQSLLQNRHLHKLTALAIKAKLLEAARNEASFLPPNVARLKMMAKNIEADWQELPETLAVHLAQQQLVNDDLQHWFLEARDNPHPTALTVEHWTDYLRAIGIKHGCELDADKLTLMAERLHLGLPVAVRELLKDDFAHGGEAFAALLLRMLADIYGAVQDVQQQAGSDPALLPQVQQLRTSLRLIGGTITQRFDDLPTRDELLPLLDEIKQAQTDHFAVLKEMLDRALTSGVRPRLQPFTPPRMFPPSASKLFGREEQGGQLLELVRRHRRVAVTGDGGLGKTALAAEVLQQLSQESNGAEWFAGGLFLHDFYQQPTFGAFVETILAHAGQSGQTPDEQIALAAEVLKRPGTFVYLEGTEKLATELPAVLRLLDGNTRLLLTTREPRQAAGMQRVALKTIDLDEAAAAIRHYMTQSREHHEPSPPPFADDDPAWHDLARDMGGHALGCKLVGQLCGELAIAPAELHTTLAEQGLTVLAAGDSSKDNLDVLFRQSALAFCASGQPEPCDALRAWQALTLAGTNLMPRSVLRELGVSQHDGLLALIRRGLVVSAQLPPDNQGQTEPAYALTHALLAEWARACRAPWVHGQNVRLR